MARFKDLEYNDSFTICKGQIHKEQKEIILHPNTKVIARAAFTRSPITKITLNEGLEQIGYGAFSNCKNLTEVNFPESITLIENSAFFNTSIKTVNLYNCLSLSLGTESFRDAKIEELTLPYTLKTIPGYCFNSNNFRTVKLPRLLEHIGTGAFSECYNLEEIDFKNTKKIDGMAFINCTNLTKIVFNGQLKQIGNGCFAGCSKLSEVNLKNTELKKLSYSLFENCTNLEKIILPDSLESLSENCFKATKITLLDIPSLIDYIPDISTKEITCFCKDPKKVETSSSKIKLQQMTLDDLLNDNKSFKEINNILKDFSR